MKRNFLRNGISLALLPALGLMVGCESTVSSLHMKQANTLLAEAHRKTKSGDFAGADAVAATMATEVRRGVVAATAEESPPLSAADFSGLLDSWESGAYRAWRSSLQAGDAGKSAASLAAVRSQCMVCHASIGRPNIGIAGSP